MRCRLPANLDAKAQLTPVVAETGRTCAVSGVRSVGSSASGEAYYEIGCSDGLGFVLKRSPTAKPEVIECSQALGSNLECKLTTKDQIDAKMKAMLVALVAKSGKTCPDITAQRAVGQDRTSGTTYYEVACGKTGFMIAADKSGNFERAVDCANAGVIVGGCKLSDVSAAETEEASLYTKLANAGGFSCQVSKYHYIGTVNKNDELVELACSNRPDGAVAIFPDDKATKPTFYDCVRAGAVGQSCHLSSPSVMYAKYQAALASKGKSSCQVSNAAWVGHSASENADLVETACSDGLPGWVVVMNQAGQATDLLSCGQAKAAGVTCKLPGNAK